MYPTSLYYRIKKEHGHDYRILEIFFKAWIDDNCDNEVQYKDLKDTIQVDFEQQEDAVAVKLKGIPFEFKGYLEMIN